MGYRMLRLYIVRCLGAAAPAGLQGPEGCSDQLSDLWYRWLLRKPATAGKT